MTFAPDSSPRMGMPSAVRVFLFWGLMILLAVFLWRMFQTSNNGKQVQAINYSNFMQQVDLKNIASVRLYTSQSTTDIQGEFRQPPQGFKVTIPKEVIQPLMDRLRNQGVPIEVRIGENTSWASFAINIAPFIMLLGLWVFMLKRRQTKPDQSKHNDLSNRPIG